MAPIDRPHNREVLSQLMEKASVQGYLTTDDLQDASPELGEDSERLSIIMLALRHRGVDMLDSNYEPLSTEVDSLGGDGGH
jgi:RNA polymerase primary sigma factor